MTWRLTPEGEKTIEIQGVKVTFRPLTGAALANIRGFLTRRNDGLWVGDMVPICKTVGPFITSISGFSGPPTETLLKVKDPNIVTAVIDEIVVASQLDEDEAKNSGSSSGMPSSAGDVPVETASKSQKL